MTIEDVINNLKPAQFKYNDTDKISFGFIAQDIEEILPQDKYSIVKNDDNNIKMVDYSQFISLLVGYCQHLSKRVEELEKMLKK